MRKRIRLVAVLTASALALVACGSDEPTVPDPEDVVEDAGEGLAGAVPPVAMVDNNFAPSNFAAPAGEEITLTVTNNGQNPHTFTIESLNVDTGILESGQQAEVSFTMPDEEVPFICTVHGEAMSGTIDPA